MATSIACVVKPEADQPEPPATEPCVTEPLEPSAIQTIRDLEGRLIGATEVEIVFVVDSDGAFVSHLEGTLHWQRDGEISLTATGEFGGLAQALELSGDADSLETLASGKSTWTGERPPELIEAIVVGITRMGLLHNLAMLVGGDPPDHADGGLKGWVELSRLELGPPIEFDITVSGVPSGRAALWLDPLGLPTKRVQTVSFPKGEMRVTERYTSFTIR